MQPRQQKFSSFELAFKLVWSLKPGLSFCVAATLYSVNAEPYWDATPLAEVKHPKNQEYTLLQRIVRWMVFRVQLLFQADEDEFRRSLLTFEKSQTAFLHYRKKTK